MILDRFPAERAVAIALYRQVQAQRQYWQRRRNAILPVAAQLGIDAYWQAVRTLYMRELEEAYSLVEGLQPPL